MNLALLPVDEFGVWRTGNPPSETAGSDWAIRVSPDMAPVGDLWSPTWAEVDFTDGVDFVSSRGEVRDGAPRVVEFIRRGPDLQQKDLTESDISMVLTVMAKFSMRITDRGDVEPRIVVEVVTSDRSMNEVLSRLLAQRRNRKVTQELLERVAEVYRANMSTGPTKAVREAFFVSERQAGNYVKKARDAGLLPPTTSGKKKG